MASTTVPTARKTPDQRLAELPVDAEIEILTDPDEIAFLTLWREADDAGRQRIDKALALARAGRLPDAETLKDMSQAEKNALLDRLEG